MNIKALVEEIYEDVVRWRRDFHKYPELGRNEMRTKERIVEILRKSPVEIKENVGGYGVVALLRGAEAGDTIAFRADMDALPIVEINDKEFKSINEGVMHGCGHDGHMAILLGVIHVLCKVREHIKGNIKFIFQPAEELAPIGGAKLMIEEGVLENPKVSKIFGLHIWPGIEEGCIGIKEGAIMASSDPFTIEVKGKSGHASAPNEAIDGVVITANIVTALQTIVSRNVSPLETAVVTIGKMNSGKAYNVIADDGILEGTVRTLNNQVKKDIVNKMEVMVNNLCEAYGGYGKVYYQEGYPALINSKAEVEQVVKATEEALGEDKVTWVKNSAMGGEDFARYVEKVPGAFFWLGAGISEYPIHHPKFDFNEEIMKDGIEIFVRLALQEGLEI